MSVVSQGLQNTPHFSVIGSVVVGYGDARPPRGGRLLALSIAATRLGLVLMETSDTDHQVRVYMKSTTHD